MQKITALIAAFAIAALVGLGGWWTIFIRSQLLETSKLEEANEELQNEVREKDEKIVKLDEEVTQKTEEIVQLNDELEDARRQIQELETAMWLLKLNHRVARFEVIEQVMGADGQVTTTVEFTELGAEGEPVGAPRTIVIEGKQLYVEGLVIKFDDGFVEGGDLLRGSSIAILKRVFSEEQAPNEGTELDMPRMHPLPGRDDDIGDPFYEELWEQFWDYANDPAAAAEKGVRAMHAEAPSIELREGKSYRVELRASGGLSIRAEDD